VTKETATARVETTVENGAATTPAEAALRVRLVSPAGDEVAAAASPAIRFAGGERRTIVLDLAVPAPVRWTLDAPRLYRAEVQVVRERAVVDAVHVPFGIRTIEIDAERGFRLNGEPMKLRGACVHHDNGPLGAAAIDRAEERKIELLKANGYNAVRTSHAPPAPAFLDAADRLGLLVMDESFDMWRRPKRPDDYAREFDTWWTEDLDAMVLRDRNHPSVVMWSIGNEVPERADPEGFTYARRLAGRVRALDPTRPVTAALNDVGPKAWEETDGTFASLEVAGYNYLPQKYAPDHRRVPSRVIVATESFPLQAFEAWTAVEDNPHVIGDFVWTGIDYLGESGIGHTWDAARRSSFLLEYPWHVSNCGDLDICGWKRPPSFYRDVLWRVGAPLTLMVHPPSPGKRTVSRWGWPDVVPSWDWKGHEGRPLQVDVYSTASRVDLLLDDTRIGSQPTSRDTKYLATFTVPYRPGVLRAVGYDAAGTQIARSELRTPGAPAALRTAVDRAQIAASRDDLAYVTVEVVDARGDRVLAATPMLTFRLSGPAELAAVANADPTDVSSYRGSVRKAWQGRALAIVRPTQGRGTARLEVTAVGLTAAVVEIAIR
jgi:beta-galactosidase